MRLGNGVFTILKLFQEVFLTDLTKQEKNYKPEKTEEKFRQKIYLCYGVWKST